MLVLKGLVGLHRTVQLQLLQRYWLRHRLGLLWYWMVCLRNEQRSLWHFWDYTQVLHFGLFCWLYRASPSLAAKNIINLILVLTIWWCPCVEFSLVLLEEIAMTRQEPAERTKIEFPSKRQHRKPCGWEQRFYEVPWTLGRRIWVPGFVLRIRKRLS